MAVANAMAAGAKPRAARPMNDAQATAAAKDFEAMFMAQMLQPMFEGVEVNEMFGGGHGEEMMRGILIQEYGKAMAAGGGFGLADSVKAEMIRMQGGA
jgi:Rod binding domain-containing protein